MKHKMRVRLVAILAALTATVAVPTMAATTKVDSASPKPHVTKQVVGPKLPAAKPKPKIVLPKLLPAQRKPPEAAYQQIVHHVKTAHKGQIKSYRHWQNLMRRHMAAYWAKVAKEEAARQAAYASSVSSTGGGAGGGLASIRACESGGNYSTNTGNGYYGAYQFDQSTWEAAGGTGSPASASPAEQDRVAGNWIAQGHRSAWPNC